MNPNQYETRAGGSSVKPPGLVIFYIGYDCEDDKQYLHGVKCLPRNVFYSFRFLHGYFITKWQGVASEKTTQFAPA